MTTPRKLWLGFGALTALLVLSIVLIAVRLSAIGQAIPQAANTRARFDLALTLDGALANYALAVQDRVLGFESTPEEYAAAVQGAQVRYAEAANTDDQHALAARLASGWAELERLGQAIIAAGSGRPDPEMHAAFQASRARLSAIIVDEILPNAQSSVDVRRVSLREALRDVFLFTLLVLAGAALLSVITSAAVGRGVMRDQRLIAEQAERLRTTLASIGDAVIATDANERVTNMNAVAEQLTGWTTAEAIGVPLGDVFRIENEFTREPVESPAAKALKEGTVVGLANHTVLIAKDGSEVAIDDSAAPIRCKEGEVVGCVLVFRDVTERRKAAGALRRSEHELSEFFENANFAIHWTSPDGTVLRVNQKLLEMLGYSREDYIGHNIGEFHADLPLSDDILVRLRSGEVVRDYPARMRAKDGSIRDVLIDCNGLFEDGRLVHTRCFTRDVTELRHAQKAQALLAAIVESSDDAIVGKSLEGIIQTWNSGAERIFGYSADEVVGRHISLLFPPERVSEEDDILARIRAGRKIDHFESVRLRKDGRAVHVSLTISPILDETGRVIGASKIARDISASKRAEEALRESEEALREADRRKDEFLATLSHELRNPLAPISMGLEVLKSSRLDPAKVEETRAMMARQTRQLIRLVDDLLDVSRITRGKLELRRSVVNLSDVIGSAVEAAHVSIEEGGHTLTVSGPSDPLYVDADPNRLAQILSNLLINAAKYTPKGGRIHLSAERGEDRDIVLTVADNGVGIPRDMLDHIFEMFAQLEGSGQPSASGLGIGLTLVKSLVTLHGGVIEADSDGPGRGSEFRVRLPIVAQSQAGVPQRLQPKVKGAMAGAAGKAHRRVLVVDDNQTAAAMLGMVVEMLGNEVRTAHDGRQALEIAAEYCPEIVFMDLGMPNVDGYEAAREIRKQEWGKSTLLVALTGWGQDEHKKQTKAAGFDHHMVKPSEFSDLQKLFAELEERGR